MCFILHIYYVIICNEMLLFSKSLNTLNEVFRLLQRRKQTFEGNIVNHVLVLLSIQFSLCSRGLHCCPTKWPDYRLQQWCVSSACLLPSASHLLPPASCCLPIGPLVPLISHISILCTSWTFCTCFFSASSLMYQAFCIFCRTLHAAFAVPYALCRLPEASHVCDNLILPIAIICHYFILPIASVTTNI